MLRPRVTEILSPYCDFSKVDPEVLLMASERGTIAHQACLGHAVGLWSLTIPPDVRGYFDSFCLWFDRFVVKVLAVEKELIHPRWNYVGHCDLVAIVSGYKPEPVLAVIDLKTPVGISRTWSCQIAGYVEAEQLEHKVKVYGGVLQLRKDGGLPKVTWLEDESQAFAAFCGALSAHNYIKGAK